MKFFPAIFIRILLLIFLLVLAFVWATRLMDSLYAFRSPLHEHPPVPGDPVLAADVPAPTRRVVVVLIDGLRLDTAIDSSVMPALDKLRQQSAWATMHSRPPSYSDPGYSVLFTGAWPELSDGPAMNVEYKDTPTWTQDNLFSAVHRRGLKTAVSAFYWFEKLIPQIHVEDGFYTPGEDQLADRQVVDAALPWLRSAKHQFVFIHLDQVDYAGHHEGGPRDLRWNQAARRADDLLAEILAELDLGQDTLLVLSDHGHIERGGHGGHEAIVLQEPFVLAGAAVKPGNYGIINMVDVTPTLAVLLGANLPASSQGRVLTEMLDLPPEITSALPAALLDQQRNLLAAYMEVIGIQVEVQPGPDSVQLHQEALEMARMQRLSSERTPRTILAVLLALVPLAWFTWKRRGQSAWFILAGLIYMLVFHLRYAFIDGRTYSLSSVASANDLILYTASTAAIALILGWVTAAYFRKAFKFSPDKRAVWTLELVLFVIYLLMLPVLFSLALNGFLVTWTLPHFPSMFLDFLSLIQMLAVAVVGILLALVNLLINRKADLKNQKTTLGDTSQLSQ